MSLTTANPTIITESVRKLGETLYTDHILYVVNKIGVLKARQLSEFLTRALGISQDEALRAIRNNCIDGYILLTENGYICSTGAAETMFLVKPTIISNKVINDIRIPQRVALKPEAVAHVACFDALLMFLSKDNKDATNFDRVHSPFPFSLSYIDKVRNYVVQIAYFPKDEESIRCIAVKENTPITEEDSKFIYRVAVMEDPDNAGKILHLGFAHICSFGERGEMTKHYTVKKDAWWEDANLIGASR